MNKKITINYLSHNRLHFADLMFYFLSRIKEENKQRIKLNILASYDYKWKELCEDANIDYSIYTVGPTRNFLDKLDIALTTDTMYSVKLDEDNFANNYVWDFLIENSDVLDNSEYLTLAPIMTNNIPSCDFFIEDYISDDSVKSKIYDYFLKRGMPNGLWGVDYTPLNRYTLLAKNWDPNSFYEGVAKLNTPVMGIHPLRISYEAQKTINDYIINNISKFVDKNDYSIFSVDVPYYNNGLSVIKTDDWRKIINQSSVDGFDEISLNSYKNKNNKQILFVKNAFAIHPMFNTVFGNQNPWNIGSPNAQADELDFYNNLVQKIIGQ